MTLNCFSQYRVRVCIYTAVIKKTVAFLVSNTYKPIDKHFVLKKKSKVRCLDYSND